MNFEIKVVPGFEKELKRLSKKYPSIKNDLSQLVNSLVDNPFQGDSLGRDCYKIRMKITSKGKGKSAGSRIITCIKVVNQRITLVSIYDKSEQSSISDSSLFRLLSDNGLV